jgi:hypothetical protein
MAQTGENYTTALRGIEAEAEPEKLASEDLDLEHRVYAAFDAGSARGWVARELYTTAYWREGVAEEYPEDDRNLPAARHLTHLTRKLLALPSDDPDLQKAEEAFAGDSGDAIDIEEMIIRSIGFSWGNPDLGEVLNRLAGEWRSHATMDE